MSYDGYSQLLNMLWRAGYFAGRDFVAVTGENVGVVSSGEYGGETGVWCGAEIIADGERCRGAVAISDDPDIPESAILRIVTADVPPVIGMNDKLIPQIRYVPEPEIAECYDALREGSAKHDCAVRIAGMDALRRTDLYTKLAVDRLRRKTADIMDIFALTRKDWNQTFHIMLLRAMGGNRNRGTFTELASRVTCTMVSREKSSQQRVEALLLGAAGFLHAAEEKDAYTVKLEEEFRHLANKYSIMPLKPARWDLGRLYPANHPAVRLAELAALLSKKEFMLDNMLICRTCADIEELFAAEASEYWKTHYKPCAESSPSAKRIGRAKARLVGINMVAPLMFAYGKEMGNENLCENAFDLLETIPAEKNGELDGWYGRGCVPGNSFESQALLQLNNEFCAQGGCARCHIGRTEIKKASGRLS